MIWNTIITFLVAGSLAWGPGGITTKDYGSLVGWAGCKAIVFIDESSPPIISQFGVLADEDRTPVILLGTSQEYNIPYYAAVMVIFHEIGHCLQYQEGVLVRGVEMKPIELDADRRSADLACAYGLDGRRLLRETFEWAHDSFGYSGDSLHGTLSQRIHQGDLAQWCDKHIEGA